jgi:UDP-2,4-diacetamido-2,4,6-trideoxy-beta-L-altropyranose hydrolase
MRCVSLANALRASGNEVFFVCRPQLNQSFDYIEGAGHQLLRLPLFPKGVSEERHGSLWRPEYQDEDATQTIAAFGEIGSCDWLVVDHYGLGFDWEVRMRHHVRRIMVIDDLAHRRHDCDLLLDHNFSENIESRYDQLVPQNCIKLLGPRYALLRPEFGNIRQVKRERDGSVARVLIFFGASDPSNETEKALQALHLLARDTLKISVVLGDSNPHFKQISATCSGLPNVTLYRQITYMAELMGKSDLAIGAGGGAMWERCCVGLPSIVVSTAENQEAGSIACAKSGIVLYLGKASRVSVEQLASALDTACSSPWLLLNMSRLGENLVDGKGLRRVTANLSTVKIILRIANEKDCKNVYDWRNAEETRQFSGDNSSIPFEKHEIWFRDLLSANDKALLIGEIDGCPVGVLRYDQYGSRAKVSIYLVPGNKGQGLGTTLLNCGTAWIQKYWPGLRLIEASVKLANEASIQTFKNAGFHCQYELFQKPCLGNYANLEL